MSHACNRPNPLADPPKISARADGLLLGYVRTQLQREVEVHTFLATLEWCWTKGRHHQHEIYTEETEGK